MDHQGLHDFLSITLEMPVCDLDLLKTNRFEFLEKLIKACDSHVPFQNHSHTTVPFDERHQPTVEENIDAVFKGTGGRCWTINSAMHMILKQLGFDVEAIIGSVEKLGAHNNMMNLVRNLQVAGDIYLVDVGFGSASHPPIPLDFDKESPLYSFYHQRIKWVKEGDLYIRKELHNPAAGQHFGILDGDWEIAIYFYKMKCTLDDIKTSIGQVSYTVPTATFNTARYMMKFNPEFDKFVYLRNMKLTLLSRDRAVEKIELKNKDDVIDAMKKYFPKFPLDIALASYDEWYEHDRALMAK